VARPPYAATTLGIAVATVEAAAHAIAIRVTSLSYFPYRPGEHEARWRKFVQAFNA
jgi:hypothetical protein